MFKTIDNYLNITVTFLFLGLYMNEYKVKKTDVFSLMHYEKLNYIQAIRLLNEYYLDKIPKEHLEIIEDAKKLEGQDCFWKTLYLLIFG